MQRILPIQAPNGPATITDSLGNMWHNHKTGFGVLFQTLGMSMRMTPAEIENMFGVSSYSYPKAG